jgi:hypothetical protein
MRVLRSRVARSIAVVMAMSSACSSGGPDALMNRIPGDAPTYEPARVETTDVFPTASSTGVPSGRSLTLWDGPLMTSEAELPTVIVDGRPCDDIDGYRFELTGDQQLRIDSPCVLIRRSSFVTDGDTSALVIQTADNDTLHVDQSTFDGGPRHVRGVQADFADVTVQRSSFVRFGNAAVEMSDRSATAVLVVEGCFMEETPGWPRDQHVDGVQMNAGGALEVRGNTILVAPFGGSVDDYSYVSNAAVGVGASLGDVGDVTIEGNLLAGGGRVLYLQEKDFRFTGSVLVASNVFDQRFLATSAIWGVLYPDGVPAALEWRDNALSDGADIDLATAQAAAA